MEFKDFYKKISEGSQIVTIDDMTAKAVIKINQENYFADGLIFKDCNFQDDLIIEDVDLNFGIKFINCTFNKNLKIIKIKISRFDPGFNPDNESFQISKCRIIKDLIFYPESLIIRDICIKESEINAIQIYRLRSNEGGLKIEDTVIKSNSRLELNEFNLDIYFRKVTTLGSLRFVNNTASSYVFKDNTFESDAWIWYGNVKNGIIFNNGIYKGTFRIESVKANGSLSIINAKYDAEVIVEYESKHENNVLSFGCPKIFIRDSEFNNGINVIGGMDFFSPYTIEEIEIDASKKLKGEISFSKFDIRSLKISGNNYDSNIIFDNNQFIKILFERFTNFGTVQFIEVRGSYAPDVQSVFSSNNSSLGRFLLTNVSFERFQKVAIENSNLSGVIASNVKWFSLEQLEKPDTLRNIGFFQLLKRCVKFLFCNVESLNADLHHYRRKRELFRQLKFAMEQQGNRIQSIVFKQYEMIFFTRELRLTKSIFDKDRLIMELSCTNSHGQNWLKPLLWLFFMSCIFGFILFLFNHPILTFKPSFDYNDIAYTISEFWLNKKVIVQILSPGHLFGSFVRINNGSSGWLFATDLLYRVIYAFFVFQIVTAFRKYIK